MHSTAYGTSIKWMPLEFDDDDVRVIIPISKMAMQSAISTDRLLFVSKPHIQNIHIKV